MLTDAQKKELEALKGKNDRSEDENDRLESLEAMADADEKAYPEAVVKDLRKQNAKYRTRAKELEERLAKYAGMSPEEIAEMKSAAEKIEEKNLERKGEWEKLREKLSTQHAAAIAAKDKIIAEMEQKTANIEAEMAGVILGHEISLAAATAKAINPELVEMVAKKYCKVETDDNGRRTTVVTDPDGERRIDMKTGKPMTTAQLIDEMKSAREYAHLFEGARPGAGSRTEMFNGERIANPWKKETFNLTRQGQIYTQDPTLAARLRAEAGK